MNKINNPQLNITRVPFNICECLPDRHKKRDNKFGVTWCVKCGQLFNTPSGISLQENDKLIYTCQ